MCIPMYPICIRHLKYKIHVFVSRMYPTCILKVGYIPVGKLQICSDDCSARYKCIYLMYLDFLMYLDVS